MARNDGGISPDYTDPEARSARTGATHEALPSKGSSRTKWIVTGFVVLVLGLLVSRAPFLAGSLNAGVPLDETETALVRGADDGVDTSSALPTPDELTPARAPAE